MTKNIILYIVIVLFIISITSCINRKPNLSTIVNKKNKEVKSKVVTQNNKKEEINLKYGKKNINVKFEFTKISDKKVDRKLKKINLFPKFKLGGITDTIFKLPISVKTDDNQNIYVLDQMDKSVSKFNKEGKFLKKYGRFGRGPGEFLFSQGFDVFGDGKIVVADPNNNKITVFEDKKIYEYKCRLGPIKVSFVSSNEAVIFQILDPIFTSMVRKINYKNQTIVDYQNILNKDSFKDDVYGILPFLIGDLYRYKNNNTVYTSRVMNYVVVFNGEGEIDSAFKMIDDDLDLSNVSIEKFPKDLTYQQTCVWGDELFVYKELKKTNENICNIDIYSISTGKYKYSLSIKNIEDIQSISFMNKMIFIIKDDTEIDVYEYKIIDEDV